MNKHHKGSKKTSHPPSPASNLNFPLPEEVAKILRTNPLKNCKNIGLLISRYITKWDNNWKLEGKSKGDFLKIVEGVSYPEDSLTSYRLRFEASLNSLKRNGWQVERFSNLKTQWRMVVGLGSGSILETSMTLHRIYGFPIIPGSALKGLTKAYANTVEEISDSDKQITDIFGSQSSEKPSQGKVIFFDAIPLKFPKLKLDIMNPHYQEYYSDSSDKTPPADYLSPNPIFFLTVGEGAEFYFAVASKEENLAKSAKGLLEKALKELGVGAKTSAGYGYFE
jgi:CRISPR-associated protein Cmr6